MRRLWNNIVVKNKYNQVRSGWIILIVMASFYLLQYFASYLLITILEKGLISTGDINPATNYFSDYVVWLDDVALPIVFQIITDTFMIAIPVIACKLIMKNKVQDMGLSSLISSKKDGCVGMLLGIINCTVVFLLVITLGGGHVVSWSPKVSVLTVWWILIFVIVALGEEIMNRGFLMATLRRSRNIYFIMLVPSIIFGLIHLSNPDVTFFSIFNIMLVGILFSYMFIKSGNIWMCIGYHFTWNTFEGVVYGMPVSGLKVPGIITTQFPHGNILNGGMFGIEGGILTTLVTLISFLFVRYYYRKSRYNFIDNK